jgi:hypothetical protein
VTIDPPVIAFGLGVGILIGLTGIAGGSLMTLSGVPCEQHSVPIGGHVKAIAAAIGLGSASCSA